MSNDTFNEDNAINDPDNTDRTYSTNRPNDADSTALTTETADNGQLIQVDAGAVKLSGLLHLPANAHGLVLLTHGIEGSIQNSHQVALMLAQVLFQDNLATLLIDLFTAEEQQLDDGTNYFRDNTSVMQQRIAGIAEWLVEYSQTQHLSVGYFGAGATGASVLIAAAERPDVVAAVVSAGGTLDPAEDYLRRVLAPTLLIASSQDKDLVTQSQQALENLAKEKQFEQIDANNASLFTARESIANVAQLTSDWFNKHLVTIA